MRVSERYVTIDFIESKDYGSAGILSDAVHLGKLSSFSVVITFGAITGNSTLIVYASAARDLTTTAIAFTYRVGAGVFKAALADQFGDAVAVTAAGQRFTKPWLTFNIDATATAINVGAIGVGLPRYPGHLIPSVL